ncbi:DUF1643 domain-containing protein [Cronobacter malonaticus]
MDYLQTNRKTDTGKTLKPWPVLVDHYNSHLIRLVSGAGLVVAAWGNEGRHLKRSTTVRQLLPESTMCFVLNATGEPKHPLYMKNDSVLIPLG